MSLMRRDPFGEMMSLRQAMDRLLEESVVRPRATMGVAGAGMGMDLDVMEREDAIVVRASLPGVKPDDVNITVENNILTIQAETREEQDRGEGRYHHRERRYGRVARAIVLPVEVDPNACDADFEHGVLTITLAKSQQARARRIAVRGQGQPAERVSSGQTAQGAGRVIEGQMAGSSAGGGATAEEQVVAPGGQTGMVGAQQTGASTAQAGADAAQQGAAATRGGSSTGQGGATGPTPVGDEQGATTGTDQDSVPTEEGVADRGGTGTTPRARRGRTRST